MKGFAFHIFGMFLAYCFMSGIQCKQSCYQLESYKSLQGSFQEPNTLNFQIILVKKEQSKANPKNVCFYIWVFTAFLLSSK